MRTHFCFTEVCIISLTFKLHFDSLFFFGFFNIVSFFLTTDEYGKQWFVCFLKKDCFTLTSLTHFFLILELDDNY